MEKDNNQIIGITMGDPSGIGPEIILKSFSLKDINNKSVVVIGDLSIMLKACSLIKEGNIEMRRINSVSEALFEEQTLNIMDLQLIDIDKFQPGTVNEM